MSEIKWQLLTTLCDVPSAQAFAEILAAEGIAVRVTSEANVLGQAAPCQIHVDAAQLHRAQWTISQRAFTDEELAFLATGELGGDVERG